MRNNNDSAAIPAEESRYYGCLLEGLVKLSTRSNIWTNICLMASKSTIMAHI